MMLRKKNRFLCLLKPLSIVLLLFLIFAIVWLRSSVVALEYRLGNLEKKKMELLRDRKVFLAEQSNLLYVGRLHAAAANSAGLTFPDRVKVVYVTKEKNKEAFTASLKAGKR